ncbi:serine hydrolase [Sphingomonas sp. H39-1-10]|uniref:serine hydrolase domain-containing protein n=1 Tax=Sphingomonas TaxID=13687 RepID=UPI00088C0C87|nr:MULTISPECIES: serine hydrolase domain-containing protein [Sphingomonas]MDF0486660.1 serine hydrolase [Sphingomonas pollutisoli]SDA35607.1 CubicO group peptidase, beta-lactamase class C family [Sphingomonas sp. NFR15]
MRKQLTQAVARLLGLVMPSLLLIGGPIAAQVPATLVPAKPAAATQTAPAATAATGVPALTKADVDAWLDGLFPYGLDTGNIAGAVVVVVKDGQVVTERGYGYADRKAGKRVDPDTTLFRPGSISKLFTWTAVMQQVQAGKLDLDRDINTYLDFKIPAAYGKPVTLRNLMTHTGGFEETAKYLIATDPRDNRPLDVALKRSIPARIYAPGTMPAYSNYGASLAGYIVQRVSGEAFEAYVQRHIFAPLGMTRSSFVQPLPADLAPLLSKGYVTASDDPKPYEIIPLSPAGALSATGADMAKFMIAHLSSANPLLDAKTARLMYATANTPIPGMPGMALGFYHEDRNGLNIIGHGGDTDWFHSDLHLYLDKGVGLYMSFNSAGKDGAAHVLRQRVFDSFTDRYFPAKPAAQPTLDTAAEHGRAMAGNYVSSRGSTTNWLRIANLIGQPTVALNADGTITVSALTDPAGVPKRWREVAPWQWQEVGGSDRLGAKVRDGRVLAFAPQGFAPIFLFVPASTGMNAVWIVPVLLAALAVMLVVALNWPIVALARRRYGYRSPLSGRPLVLRRTTALTAWIMLVIAVGWMGMLSALSSDVAYFDGRLDIWMRLLQLLSLAAIVGTAFAVWNAVSIARAPQRRIVALLWSVVVAVAMLFLVWLMFDMRTLTPSLNF